MELAEQVLRFLLDNKLHISFVESCTGGMLASTLIGVSGASGAIEQSFVTYSNRAKQEMVGVSPITLEKYGAVSAQTAIEMAQGGAAKSGSEVCVSVTGNAGPSADEGKPVGLVYIGLYYKGETKAYELNLAGNRQEIRKAATENAFELLLKIL